MMAYRRVPGLLLLAVVLVAQLSASAAAFLGFGVDRVRRFAGHGVRFIYWYRISLLLRSIRSAPVPAFKLMILASYPPTPQSIDQTTQRYAFHYDQDEDPVVEDYFHGAVVDNFAARDQQRPWHRSGQQGQDDMRDGAIDPGFTFM